MNRKHEKRNVNGSVTPGTVRTVLQLTDEEKARVRRIEARDWLTVCQQFDAEMAALKRAEAEEKRAAIAKNGKAA